MNTREFLSSVGLILAVMATVAMVERIVPLFTRPDAMPGRRRTNLAMTCVTLSFAFVLTSSVALVALYLPVSSPRLMSAIGLPIAAQFAISVVAADFAFGYVAHWSMHVSPVLWRFHRVHHSDPFVDVTTTYRTHPVENAWRHLWLFSVVWALGIPAAAVVTFRVLSAVNGVLEHANVRVRPALDALVSLVWVTPNMHKVHHSRDQAETNSNYGNLFALHDRLFRTFMPTTRAFVVKYGLGDVEPDEMRSVSALLAMPWRPRRGTRFEEQLMTSLGVGGSK